MKYSGADHEVYAGTTVLRNLAELRDQVRLTAFENEMVAVRMLGLPDGGFDAAHLRAIHRHLFQDVYAFAGTYRGTPLAKGASRFCQPQYIARETDKALSGLDPQGMARAGAPDLAEILARVLGELNAVHPFREGNGRVIRALAGLLAESRGFVLDFSRVGAEEWTRASIASFQGDARPLAALVRDALRPCPPGR